MRRSQVVQLTTLLGFAAVLSACATLSAGVDPAARQAGVTAGAFVYLRGNIEGVTFYKEGDPKPLKVVMQSDMGFKDALKNEGRRVVAENSAGTSSYTQTWYYAPVIYLDRKPQRVRLVRSDGQEAIVAVKPHVGMKYVAVDWLLVANGRSSTSLM